jgi:hypothetical protein
MISFGDVELIFMADPNEALSQKAHSYLLWLWNPKAPRHSGASIEVALSMQHECPQHPKDHFGPCHAPLGEPFPWN